MTSPTVPPAGAARGALTRRASLLGSSCPAASPAGTGGHDRLAAALLLAVLALTLACWQAGEDTAIPGRSDLAQASRAVLPGTTYEHRDKIRQGMRQTDLTAAIGKPSEQLESRGQIVSGHWTYLYKDGKITINLRDGVITEIETTFY